MTQSLELRTGGCLCASVRFEAHGSPRWVGICHCHSCRKATGGALVTAAGFAATSVELHGETLAEYHSSPGVRRFFCRRCGTSLAYRNARWADDIHLMAGAFDEPGRLAPEFHLFAGQRLAWLCLSDALPRYVTTPSAGDLLES